MADLLRVRFSTEVFPARERLEAWRELFGRSVVKLCIEPATAEDFHSEATMWSLPGLGVLSGSSSAARLLHRASSPRTTTSRS
jgi:hypothetical protein